jgi:DHA1 family bicyclomycin/chloramphenicol resistance-like MFS transporter
MPLAVVRDVLDGSAARARMSEVTTINSMMPILAPIIGSMVVRAANWRVLFGTQGIFAGGIVLVLLFGFQETLPLDRRHPLRPADLFRNYQHLLCNRGFLGNALINALGFACIFSFISVSPLILMQRMGATHATYPIMFSAIAAGTILGGFVSVILNRRQTPVRTIITSGLVIMLTGSVSATALQIAGLHRPFAILPCTFAALFGFGLISPSVTLEALAPVPSLAGSGSGALRSILMIFGSGTSALLATYCASHPTQVEVATTLMMSSTVSLAMILHLFITRPLRREADGDQGHPQDLRMMSSPGMDTVRLSVVESPSI